MADRSIASRPTIEQTVAIVNFMAEHPSLGFGKLRGLDGREEGKKLWLDLTRIANNIPGPVRPMKSWVKFWSDKKSNVRSKVVTSGGDPNILSSSIERRIWDLFLAKSSAQKGMQKVKKAKQQQAVQKEETYFDEEDMEENPIDTEPVMAFEIPVIDLEERQMAAMERLAMVMGKQSAALCSLADASHVNSQAMQRLAEAAQIQAKAIDRLSCKFETIGSATHDVRNAVVDIDSSLKRFYSASTT